MTADLLAVELSSWIIQDGNYGDFACGDRAAFALEFHAPQDLTPFAPEKLPVPSLTDAGAAAYDVFGQAVYVADDWWVIDAGVVMFRHETPPKGASPGSWVRGAVSIGIDPFLYFERLALRVDAPALIYDWRIEKIEM